MKIKQSTLMVLIMLALIPLVLAFVNNGNQPLGGGNCYADINTGEMICGDGDPGNQCVSGNDCSGDEICINGMCRVGESECVDYQGYGCSVDGNAWSSSDGGTCTSTNSGVCDYVGSVRMNCGSGDSCDLGSDATYSTCTLNSGDSCDSSAGGNFVQDGICANIGGTFNCNFVGYTFYNPSSDMYFHYVFLNLNNYDYDLDPNGTSCDQTLTNGDYYPDGMVTATGVCTPVGSTVRVDASDNNYFKFGCDNSEDICDSSISSDLTSPFSADGTCRNNVCVINGGPKGQPI